MAASTVMARVDSVPQDSWDALLELASNSEQILGLLSGGGWSLVVNATTTTEEIDDLEVEVSTLDKTWGEIATAMESGPVVVADDDGTYAVIAVNIVRDEGVLYYVNVATLGFFYAESGDGYPSNADGSTPK